MTNYPRVSEILRWATEDPMLVHPWYLRRGSWTHAACDLIACGESLHPDTIAYGNVDRITPTGKHERLLDFVDCYREFLRTQRVFSKLILSETRIVNEVERYTGKPDQVWLMVDGKTEAVVDLKTGGVPKSVGLQTAAYDLALPLDRRRKRFALQLCPDEAPKLIECKDHRDWDKWRLLVRAYHVAREYSE